MIPFLASLYSVITPQSLQAEANKAILYMGCVHFFPHNKIWKFSNDDYILLLTHQNILWYFRAIPDILECIIDHHDALFS